MARCYLSVLFNSGRGTARLASCCGRRRILTLPSAWFSKPTRQRVMITQWPQSLDPFWASLTKAKTPNTEVDGPRMVERPISIETGDRFKVQILVDGSIVEAFVNDQLAMSYRSYETGGTALFGLFADDVSVSFEGVRVSKES